MTVDSVSTLTPFQAAKNCSGLVACTMALLIVTSPLPHTKRALAPLMPGRANTSPLRMLHDDMPSCSLFSSLSQLIGSSLVGGEVGLRGSPLRSVKLLVLLGGTRLMGAVRLAHSSVGTDDRRTDGSGLRPQNSTNYGEMGVRDRVRERERERG